MLELRNIGLDYQTTQVLSDFNLSIEDGEILVLIGPSGCGKSSILNIIAGNLNGYTGEVLFNGEGINYKQKTVGLVSQDYGLLPWRTIYKNVILPLKIKKLDIRDYEKKIDDVLYRLGIADLKDRYPHQLSGGQKQRASIAKAFIMDLDLLLLDEPFSALDAITREETSELFLRVRNERKPTTILVTHSIEEAVYLGERIVILSKDLGKIIQIIHNKSFGLENPRDTTEFSETSKLIRDIIKKEWHNEK